MLAQILPGFRDFRTPLVTGYLWLLSLWILLGKPIPTKERTTGLMGTMNAISEYLSSATILAVLSFVAYLIGILLVVDGKVAARLVRRYGWSVRRTVGSDGKKHLKFKRNASLDDYERIVGTSSGLVMRKLLWDAFNRTKKRMVPWETVYEEYGIEKPDQAKEAKYFDAANGNPDELHERLLTEGLQYVAPILLADMEAEIPNLATKLQEKNKELYETYNREKSESEFRLSVALPIAVASVLILVFGLSQSHTLNISMGALGLAAALVLLRKGWVKSQESTNVIVTALEISTIQSSVLTRLNDLEGATILSMQGDPVIRE